MHMCRLRNKPGRSKAAAFTVTELMVAVALMAVVVYALYSVFNQTQRALRANESQVDTTERGRGVLELVSRDMELARVGGIQNITNFYALPAPYGRVEQDDRDPNDPNIEKRTNYLYSVYYLTQRDRGWRGVGYALYLRNPLDQDQLEPTQWGMGSLYRYETRTNYGVPTTNLFAEFAPKMPNAMTPANPPVSATNFNHIADGVVHFRVKAYDTQGHLMAFNTTNRDPAYVIFRCTETGARLLSSSTNANANNATAILQENSRGDWETKMSFRSNAAPAYLEIELGILEPDAVKTFELLYSDERKSGGQGARARQWLEKRINKVQIFRKRIPLRTVSP